MIFHLILNGLAGFLAGKARRGEGLQNMTKTLLLKVNGA
jgi:hypothetical protein